MNSKDASALDITLAVTNQLSDEHLGTEGELDSSGLKELRLFRNGQQVGYTDELQHIEPGATESIQFTGIRLPSDTNGQFEFTAHAFNEDGVKGNTTRKLFASEASDTQRAPRAYILSIGVNEYENASWNLDYAKADATAIADTITEQVSKLGQYQDIVKLKLVSGDTQPTRARIEALFARLAGNDTGNELIDEKLLAGIEGADQLQEVHPDDLVLVSFAGHGYAEAGGQFHLFPYDIGAGTSRSVNPDILTRTITSTDLDLWLRNIDAGEFVMIIDACNSAASVEGQDFKPGPMGSRGLGQLAYNKGMKVLAASQAEFVALESARLKHGLLTYSLVREGLDLGLAQQVSSDSAIDTREWLNYGQQRVPELHKQLVSDPSSLNLQRGFQAAIKPVNEVRVQRPGLFDFSRKTPAVISIPQAN